MQIEIVGRNLPGRSCGPRYNNIYVGIQRRREVLDLVPGDANSARWNFDCETTERADGVDFRGPYIQGKPGERFIYLSWGTVSETGKFEMFRRAKLQLNAVDADTLRRAVLENARLVVAVNLTDNKGNPACAVLNPPQIAWSAGHEES